VRCYRRGRIKTNAHLNVPSQNAVDNLWTSKIALASQLKINKKTTAKVSPSRKILHLILPKSPKALSRKSQYPSGLIGTHTHTHTHTHHNTPSQLPQRPLTNPPIPLGPKSLPPPAPLPQPHNPRLPIRRLGLLVLAIAGQSLGGVALGLDVLGGLG